MLKLSIDIGQHPAKKKKKINVNMQGKLKKKMCEQYNNNERSIENVLICIRRINIIILLLYYII